MKKDGYDVYAERSWFIWWKSTVNLKELLGGGPVDESGKKTKEGEGLGAKKRLD